MKHLIQALAVASWICGIAVANGFWSTAFSIIAAPYAWYLLAERVMA